MKIKIVRLPLGREYCEKYNESSQLIRPFSKLFTSGNYNSI